MHFLIDFSATKQWNSELQKCKKRDIRLGMKTRCERAKEMETSRRVSRHFGGDSAHLTRSDCLGLEVELSENEGRKAEESKGLLLTCAVVPRAAISTEHHDRRRKSLNQLSKIINQWGVSLIWLFAQWSDLLYIFTNVPLPITIIYLYSTPTFYNN